MALADPATPWHGSPRDIRDTYVGKILATEPRTRERVKKNPKAIREVRERVVEKHGKK